MTRLGGVIGPVAAALALVGPSPVAAEGPGPLRTELEMLEAILDKAVGRVSRARPGLLLGGERARGYHLKGYGAVFVLAPRLLPGEQRMFVVRGGAVGAGGPARRQVQRLERAGEGVARAAGQGRDQADEQLQLIVDQLEAFQREAERHRLEAEERLDQIAREMRSRWGPPPGSPEAETPPPAPPPPAPGSPAPAPMAPSSPTAPAPPWRFWFETSASREERPPERIVGDVREAVAEALEVEGGRLRSVGPEEFVAVAIDFVPGGMLARETPPARTLVVRVRKKELEQRQAGKIAPEELRRRIEYIEY
jgi:hypothetical protein